MFSQWGTKFSDLMELKKQFAIVKALDGLGVQACFTSNPGEAAPFRDECSCQIPAHRRPNSICNALHSEGEGSQGYTIQRRTNKAEINSCNGIRPLTLSC